MKSTEDMHVHTLVSDGTRTPMDMLQAASEAGVGKLSFCDHDALGAYRHWGDMFSHGKKLGVELTAGIELDTDYLNREVHLLGYGFDLNDGPLNQHLDSTQKLRKERVTLQIAVINRFFGRNVIDLDQVLFPSSSSSSSRRTSNIEHRTSVRDTLMKPHLVHAMLAEGLFADYRAAAYWVSQNAVVAIEVPKLPLAAAIAMVRAAGGDAVLAHPGYLARENNVPLATLIEELVPMGLSGLETDYPYVGSSPMFVDAQSERRFIEELRVLARRFKLKTTRGSDAHDVEALKKFAAR